MIWLSGISLTSHRSALSLAHFLNSFACVYNGVFTTPHIFQAWSRLSVFEIALLFAWNALLLDIYMASIITSFRFPLKCLFISKDLPSSAFIKDSTALNTLPLLYFLICLCNLPVSFPSACRLCFVHCQFSSTENSAWCTEVFSEYVHKAHPSDYSFYLSLHQL